MGYSWRRSASVDESEKVPRVTPGITTTTMRPRRSVMTQEDKDALKAMRISEEEKRFEQGRNMVARLSRRTSTPGNLQGVRRRGSGAAPVGGF